MGSGLSYIPKTKSFLYSSTILHEPLVSLYPLLSFILAKSLGAALFQIVLFTMLKPVASIFSFYWSEMVSQNRQTLKSNLLGAGLLARLPFLFAIFTDSVWAIIAGSTIYMLFVRAAIPAWIEMLKLNLPKKVRERFFSISSAMGYAEGALIAIGLGSLLDENFIAWKYLFAFAITLGIIGVIVQVAMPIRKREVKVTAPKSSPLSFKQYLIRPWADCYRLMKTRSDFRRFQWAFMIGGFGLMIIQPVLPIFFADTLMISYRDLMIAYSICKALGFVISSNFWAQAMSTISTATFTSLVLVGFAIYPIAIAMGIFSTTWIFIAYLIYGVAQAGSHLIWHLSGPLFAKEEDSSRYSGVNIMMVGLRGALGPPLGSLLSFIAGPLTTLTISCSLCLLGTLSMLYKVPSSLSSKQPT